MLPSAPSWAEVTPDGVAAELVVRALALVDSPYRYGGRTPAGFDCSGFVGYVFRKRPAWSFPVDPRTSSGLATPSSAAVWSPATWCSSTHSGAATRMSAFTSATVGSFMRPRVGGRVRVERISDPYWRARYNGARRLGPIQPALVANAVPCSVAVAGTYGDRTGRAGVAHHPLTPKTLSLTWVRSIARVI